MSKSSTSTPSINSTPAIPGTLSWNACRGTGGSIPYGATVFGMDQGETPPGWEPQTENNTMYLFMVNTCQRVSVGNLERGPASFMMEVHWGLQAPDSCRQFEPGFEETAALLSLWVDDPEVAAILRDELHMPVIVGNVHVETTPQAGAEIQTWTWSTEGSAESTITVSHPGGSETRGAPIDRIVWHNETGVSFLDFAQDRALPDIAAPNAEGTLAPPMRYAVSGPTPFAGLTSVWKEGDFYGPLYRFGDMQCKQPL